MVLGLPYKEIWAVDFEFVARPGERPVPVCMVARELGSGRLIRMWQDEFGAEPPFEVGDDILFVAYLASAELGCFEALGWPMPTRILDLFVEFKAKTNGLTVPNGRGLLGALSYHAISTGITKDEKTDMRNLVIAGGPWSADERVAILDYCQSDVDPMGELLERMLLRINRSSRSFSQALLRGRYMRAVAKMESVGVPIDTDYLAALRAGWEDIKTELIAAIDKDFGVYDGTTFKSGLFAAWLHDAGIIWPRHDATGKLKLDEDTFKDMARVHPQLAPLKELRSSLSTLRLEDLRVGDDGYNRVLLGVFGASTGRNQPSNTKFIFGPSVWLRGLIKPKPGRAVAYLDWSAQEVAIAAALSGDEALIEAITSGDPYLSFAKRAGLVPMDATKESHKDIRDACKQCVLGVNYGMGPNALAIRTNSSTQEASRLLRALAAAYPTYTAWSEQSVDMAMLNGEMRSVFGWPLAITDKTRPTTAKNFPMQANGAEMMRVACSLATERGVRVAAPVHDALFIEDSADRIDEMVDITLGAMGEAAQAVLGGLVINVDSKVIRYPDRYADGRGAVMWDRVHDVLIRRGHLLPETT